MPPAHLEGHPGSIGLRPEDQLILELCKSKRDAAGISLLMRDGPLDWERFLDCASRHSVAALVLDRLVQLPLPESAKKLLTERCKAEVARVMLERKVCVRELTRVVRTLGEAGIECVLMKGPSLDFSRLRAFGDLDVLVRSDDLIRAVGLLGRIRFEYVGHVRNPSLNRKERRNLRLQLSWNNQYQLYNTESRLLLELHTNLFERRRAYTEHLDPLLDSIGLFWEERQYDAELACFTLSREHSLLLACLHNAFKRSPANQTFVLRNCVDIDTLIGGEVNWGSFAETCLKLRSAPWVCFSLLLTQRLLGTEIPTRVLSTLRDDCTTPQLFLTDVHLRCLGSLRSRSVFYSKLHRILNPFVFGGRWQDRVRWLLLLPILFPPRWKMARWFHVREDSPFVYLTYILNPVRWLCLIATGVLGR